MYGIRAPARLNADKLQTRDLITIGVLDAVFVVVYAVVAMALHSNPVTFLLVTTVAAVPAGIVFMLLLAKVPKTGVLTVTGIVMGLVLLLIGHWWVMVAIEMAGGLLADIAYSPGRKRSFGRMTIAYTIYMLMFTVAAYCPMLLLTGTYIEAMGGLDSSKGAAIAGILAILTWPVIAMVMLASAAGAFTGAWLGRKLLRKHFARAGIV